MPYLSASEVTIHEEALYQVYCTFTFTFTLRLRLGGGCTTVATLGLSVLAESYTPHWVCLGHTPRHCIGVLAGVCLTLTIYGISGVGGGMRSTECHSGLLVIC